MKNMKVFLLFWTKFVYYFPFYCRQFRTVTFNKFFLLQFIEIERLMEVFISSLEAINKKKRGTKRKKRKVRTIP